MASFVSLARGALRLRTALTLRRHAV